MFLPCPHCGYLVALILPSQATRQHVVAPHCPRCDAALLVEPPAASSALAGGTAADADATLAGELPTEQPLPSAALTSTGADRAMAEASDAAAMDVSLPDASAPAADPAAATPAERDAAAAGPVIVAPVAPPTAPTSAVRDASPPIARAGPPRRVPSFVRVSTPAASARLAWPWYAAIVALGLLLALQLLLAQRHELAASARWRPWLAGLCNALPCEVPAWHEPRAFTMLDRSVQPSSTTAGVLLVEASFRNDARWPQRWPTLSLSLADVEGRQVGMRAFAPAEYRAGAAGAADAAELLAPGQSATVRWQVREPAPRVVAFTFDFQ